ncbi:MAG: DUF2179 domain-containing protein [Chloroflexi bacterium]|nr:DUF2179 domain-containing protein [Chloroflexota bacterium]
MEPLLAGLFVFGMRLTDMSLDTLRLLFTMRGRKLLSGFIGTIQATVFILAVSAVLSGPLNPFTVVGYALGFGSGVVFGMFVEERLAIGYAMLRVYSTASGHAIAEALRAAGHAVTEIQARGKEGQMIVVNCVISRRNISAVRNVIDGVDANAFVTIDQAQSLQRGYFRH